MFLQRVWHASTVDPGESINVPQSSIHIGIEWWILQHEPWTSSRRWTVTNGWGVCVLIILAILILVSQTQVWLFLRYIAWLVTPPADPPKPDDVDPCSETAPLNNPPVDSEPTPRYQTFSRQGTGVGSPTSPRPSTSHVATPEGNQASSHDGFETVTLHRSGTASSRGGSLRSPTEEVQRASSRDGHPADRADKRASPSVDKPPLQPQDVAFFDAVEDLAITILSFWSEKDRKRSSPRPRSFAFAAGLAIVITLLLELGTPYFVVDSGIFTAPVVQSRATPGCITSRMSDSFMAVRQVAPTVDGIFGQCTRQSVAGCDDAERLMPSPNIEIQRSEYCPFGDLCVEGIKPLRLTHWNITAYEVGVNSRARVTTSHRLTCVPLRRESLLRDFEMETWLSIANSSILDNHTGLARTLSLVLRTHNGPNKVWPRESSGYLAALRGGPRDLTILPMLDAEREAIMKPNILTPQFRRLDGRPFLLVYRGGSSRYDHMVDDPFFAAHVVEPTDPMERPEGYLSDHEANTLGCVEQYRFCSDMINFCSEWGVKTRTRMQLSEAIEQAERERPKSSDTEDLEWEGGELMFLHSLIAGWTSVFDHIAGRVAQGMTPLRPKANLNKHVINLFSSTRQWEIEAETWFRKSFLDAVFYAKITAQFNPDDYPADELNLCPRILFRSKDHTNINVVSFFTVLGLLAIVWLTRPVLTWVAWLGGKVRELPGQIFGS